jgi:RsiW-degrading membrane proteinase PrsW (M82 family)
MLKRPGGPLAGQKSPTKSELLPAIFNWQQVLKKGHLIPAVVTVACVVALLTIKTPTYYGWTLALYLTFASYYIFIYLLCGKAKPWWLLAASAVMTALLTASPVSNVLAYIFRHILPGNLPADRSQWPSLSFPVLFIKMLFGAGLLEELLKALPVFLFFFIGTRLQSPWRERIGVWEPLDGILIGAASGIGFTLFETLGQYVPNEIRDNFVEIGQRHGEVAGAFAGMYRGLILLIPRILDSVAGHMAYSGYFGYFIGLAALKPEKRWPILGFGYVSVAVLHALWNSSATVGTWFLLVVGILTWICLAAAILKARQLSPSRAQNFATQVIGGGAAPQAHYSLQLSGNTVGLYLGTYLFESDVPGSRSQARNGMIGEVNSNPKDPTILGLKNLSNRPWSVTAAGRSNSVSPGQSTRLVVGAQIDFGSAKGKII